MRALLLPVLLLSGAFAGCIAPPSWSDGVDAASTDVPPGTMEARETLSDAQCRGTPQRPCVAREVVVEGAMNLARLEATLETMNGVDVVAGPEGSWRLVAHLEAEGNSAQEARDSLDLVSFRWTHEASPRHALHAKAERAPSTMVPVNVGAAGTPQVRAHLALTLPASVLVTLAAETSSGGVDVVGLRTDGLSARASSGGIDLDARVTSVDARTSSGGVDARLVPTASGRIHLQASSGGVDLWLPEGSRFGYDLDASAESGGVEIGLRDGSVEGDKRHKTFRTNGFSSRDLQTQVRAQTGSGGVDVMSS